MGPRATEHQSARQGTAVSHTPGQEGSGNKRDQTHKAQIRHKSFGVPPARRPERAPTAGTLPWAGEEGSGESLLNASSFCFEGRLVLEGDQVRVVHAGRMFNGLYTSSG